MEKIAREDGSDLREDSQRADLKGDLTDEEKCLVNEEIAQMIASIRKRYKLQERLLESVADKTVPAVEPETEVKSEEPAEVAPEPEKPKRGREASTGEKKATARKKKKEVQEESKKDGRIEKN